MRQAAPPQVRLKAAGGVRTLDGMIEVVGLGCDRVGASRTAEILDDLKSRIMLSGGSILIASTDGPSHLASGY